MKNFKMLFFSLLFSLICLTGFAQRGGGGWSGNNSYSRLFNPKNIVELKGTITSIDKITPSRGMSKGIHLTLQTEKKESFSVHLGPEWFLDKQAIKFSVGDVVKVNGSKITYKNGIAIIAVSVEKSKTTLKLRDKNGYPIWSGSGQARRGDGNPLNK